MAISEITRSAPRIQSGETLVIVEYLRVRPNAAGSTRMALGDIPEWLQQNPGAVITEIRPL